MNNNSKNSGRPDPSSARELPEPLSSKIDVDVFALSDPGHVRTNNEDHYLVCRGVRNLETILTNLEETWSGQLYDETAYAMIVADGVGGEAAGEIASRNAIYTVLYSALHTPDWQFRWGAKEKNTVMWRMKDRFTRVNDALIQEAMTDPKLGRMCTTMTAALSHGKDLIVGHIGDSRAYLLRDGTLKRLTRDDTLADRWRDEDTGAAHPFYELKGALLQVLGGGNTNCSPDIQEHVLEDGDQLLLCTDGLSDMVEDSEIESLLINAPSARVACRHLLYQALSYGGLDNVTIIVARYRIPQA